jgi:hypothetical protein
MTTKLEESLNLLIKIILFETLNKYSYERLKNYTRQTRFISPYENFEPTKAEIIVDLTKDLIKDEDYEDLFLYLEKINKIKCNEYPNFKCNNIQNTIF